MKLIDILVQELPKRGGWPDGVEDIWQDYDMEMRPLGWFHDELCDDHRRPHHDAAVKINRKQYESALAASQPQWNGEGLPPVGCECEVSVDGGRSWCTYKTISEKNGMRLIEIGNFTEGFQSNNWTFRPIRSEAEQNREAAITRLQVESQSEHWQAPISASQAINIYDAIAAGKIPHIQLK